MVITRLTCLFLKCFFFYPARSITPLFFIVKSNRYIGVVIN